MLVSEVVRRVRDSAGDVSVLQFSNITLTDWINDAVRECVIENSLLQARITTNAVIGQTEYTLPQDIFKIHSVRSGNYKLEVLTLQEWEARHSGSHDAQDVTADDAYQCYVYAGVLNIWPTPSAVSTLTVNYSKMPTAIAYSPTPDSWTPDTPPIPEAFHNRIVTFCLAQVALQDDDYNKYTALMQEFKTGVINLNHMKDQEDDLYPFMSVAPRDMGETYGEWF